MGQIGKVSCSKSQKESAILMVKCQGVLVTIL